MTKENKGRPRTRGNGLHVFKPKDINDSNADVRSVLSKIFRKLVHATGRNPVQKWNECMDDFVAKINKVRLLTPKQSTYTRGNIKSELMNEKMSWFVFCKSFRFLKFPKFRIIIIATDEEGGNYYVDETVVVSNIEKDDNFDASEFQIPQTSLNNSELDSWLEDLIEKNKKKD